MRRCDRKKYILSCLFLLKENLELIKTANSYSLFFIQIWVLNFPTLTTAGVRDELYDPTGVSPGMRTLHRYYKV